MVDRDPHQRLVHGCDEAQYGRSHGEDGRAREDAENRVTATRQEMPTSGQPPGLSRQGKTRRRESAIQYASRILRSRRLFPVGPVSIASPSALKNGYASNLSSAARASSPRRRARSRVVPSTTAPAARLLPSTPSVPALSAVILSPAIFSTHASANC